MKCKTLMTFNFVLFLILFRLQEQHRNKSSFVTVLDSSMHACSLKNQFNKNITVRLIWGDTADCCSGNTDWLAPYSWALHEKPAVVHLLKNFQTSYGTRRLNGLFTDALHFCGLGTWATCA
jgi:hypothetical protein